MNKDELIKKTEEESRIFNERYGNVISALASMPSETKDDKQKRWDFIQNIKIELTESKEKEESQKVKILDYNAFAVDLLKAFQTSAAYRLIKNMQSVECVQKSEIEEKSMLDSVAFMESLRSAVYSYSLEAIEQDISFLKWIGTIYNHRKKNAYSAGIFDEKFSCGGIPQWKKPKLIRAVCDMKKMWEELDPEQKKEISLEERVQNLLREKTYFSKEDRNLSRRKTGFSKEDISDICMLVESMDMLRLDEEQEAWNGDTYSMKDKVDYQSDQKKRKDEELNYEGWMFAVLKFMETRYDEIRNATDKSSMNFFKAFMTRDLLIELKLELLSEDYLLFMEKTLGKNYQKWFQDVKEMRCTSWCSRAKKCKKGKREKGCYKRYDHKPAGDEEVFEKLKPFEKELYTHLFHICYLQGAFDKLPESLDKVYSEFLRSDFNFTDTVMANLIDASKKKISVARKKYENETKRALYHYCKAIVS